MPVYNKTKEDTVYIAKKAMAGVTGELIFEELAPQYFPGDVFYRKKITNHGD